MLTKEQDEDQDILVRDDEDTRWITLNRADALNALTTERLDVLIAAIRSTPATSGVIVLRGRPESFSSGDDLRATDGQSLAEFMGFVETIHEVARAVLAAPQVVIASLDGVVVGGGVEIASACDLRVGTKRIRVGFPDADAGMSVTGGTSVLLSRIVGEGWARHLVLEGDLIDGTEAYRLGFLTTLCEDSESLDAQTALLATRLNGRSRIALERCKRTFVDSIHEPLNRALMLEKELAVECFRSGATKEFITRWIAAHPAGASRKS
jgi:enoyl-CoA hydratase